MKLGRIELEEDEEEDWCGRGGINDAIINPSLIMVVEMNLFSICPDKLIKLSITSLFIYFLRFGRDPGGDHHSPTK